MVNYIKDLPEVSFQHFRTKINLQQYHWIHFEGRNPENLVQIVRYIRQVDSAKRLILSLELERPKKPLVQLLSEQFDYFFIGKDFAELFECKNPEELVQVLSGHVPTNSTIICAWGDRGARAINCATGKFFF